MSQLAKEDPDRPNEQRLAICFSKWRDRLGAESLHPDFMRILKLFIARYGEDGGLLKFEDFLKANRLNPSIAYSPKVQFREDFQWVAPLVQKYREDAKARYYLIRCLTANVSLNNNDYSDYEKMKQAAPSLSYRPVNIDHFHEDEFRGQGSPGGWMPYPRTRMDFTKADDLSVEGTLRVDNLDRLFQMMLEHDPSIPESEWIVHPSIEGRPDPGGVSPRDGYHFTGISFLRKGHQLPGDPLTEIYPLMLHEALSESIREEFVDRMETENESEKMKEYETDPPSQQPEVPIQCNQCGWQINRPSIESDNITCPSCGTKGDFTKRPVSEKDPTDNFTNESLDAILSVLEAIPDDAEVTFEFAEFQPKADWPDSSFAYVPPEAVGPDGKKSLRKFPYKFPDGKVSMPNVRNALARLAGANIPDEAKTRIRNLMQRILKRDNPDYQPSEATTLDDLDKAVTELFKPPHGGTAQSGDPQAVSPDGTKVTLEKPNIPTVGDVSGARIGLVEAQLREEIANLTSKVNEVTKEKDAYSTKITELQEANISLKEENVALRRTDGESIHLRTQLEEAHGKIAKEKTKVAEQKGSIKKLKETVGLREKTIDSLETSIERLEEQMGGLKVEIDKVRRDINDESGKRAMAEQKARNADVDRSRMQLENAELREEAAKHTRDLSDIAGKRSEDARRIYSLETEMAVLKEDKGKLEEMVRQLNDDLKLARRLSNSMNKKLKNAGIFEIDKEGNIKI